MGRPKISPRIQLLIRVPEDLYAEAILLHPEMQGEQGFLRYGVISKYFNRLMLEDVERTKERLREAHRQGENADARQ